MELIVANDFQNNLDQANSILDDLLIDWVK